MKYRFSIRNMIVIAVLLSTLLIVAACGSSGVDEVDNSPASVSPTQPVAIAATTVPDAPEGPVFKDSRAIGDVDGVIFMVTDASEVTFTVGEQLTRLPHPNDAVLRTNKLTGEVFLDGRSSSISFDIHTLRSDQSLRDNWVRTRMFPQDRIATFILSDATPLPDGFTDGDAVTFTDSGLLEIRGLSVPLDFEIEARDDGDELFILARTTFEWSDIGMNAPSSRGTISVDDEVRVEVLINARPLQGN
jgi:polyisoprenoid-binding protein YceI